MIPPPTAGREKSPLESCGPRRALGSHAELPWCPGEAPPRRGLQFRSSFPELLKSLARALRERATGLSPFHLLLPGPGPSSWALTPQTPPNSISGKLRVNSGELPDRAQWGVGGQGACLSGSMDFCSGFTGKAVAEGGRGSPWQLLAMGTGWLVGTNSSRGPGGPAGAWHPGAPGLPLWGSSLSWGGTETLPSLELSTSLPPSRHLSPGPGP